MVMPDLASIIAHGLARIGLLSPLGQVSEIGQRTGGVQILLTIDSTESPRSMGRRRKASPDTART